MAQRATEAAENVAAKAETTSKASANNLLVEKPHGMLGAAYIQKTVAPRGERLAGLVDPVLSPCDNFYEYTCATWAEEHPVPRGAQKVSYRSSLVDYVEKKLDDMVRGRRAP
ncbi:hypothetical protein V5799_003730 [Amblyomma americanum]|uniref:Peptidase M13 N-terminal domain-containing protein n=1 Tax=Amblyomma americanum TaxID=6943 RepID=A0AAQ4D848_AMBAM